VTLLDHPVISERYFFPRPDAPRDPWMVQGLACARRTKDRDAAVLHFHGNGEVVADWLGDFADALEAGGVDAFFAEYRGYGGSSGRPSLSALLDDALTVFDAIGRPADEIVVYGRSIGSLAAAHVAAHRDVKALVLESGISDLAERLLVRVRPEEELGVTEDALRAAVKESLDQEAKIARAKCPVLVLHAENDHLVGKHHAERNAKAAGSRAEIVMYPAGDHNSIHVFNGADIARRVMAIATARRPGS
jgi:pimeloyl-ACP methyl ester carboxylesterase